MRCKFILILVMILSLGAFASSEEYSYCSNGHEDHSKVREKRQAVTSDELLEISPFRLLISQI